MPTSWQPPNSLRHEPGTGLRQRLAVFIQPFQRQLTLRAAPFEYDRSSVRKEGDSVHLTLYVNGKKIASATDTQDAPAINAFVAYGFFAYTSKAESEFRYDDFVAEALH
jgi:hypothetical protein